MPSVNKVILVGSLGRDPEVRYSPDGAAICNISLATSSSWKDKATGEKKESTEWHRVVFYNRLAEIAGEYLKKGSPVYVEGSLKTRKWQDKDTGADKFTTEIVVANMQLIGGRPDGGGQGAPSGQQREQGAAPRGQGGNEYSSARNGTSRPATGQSAAPNFADMDDDIPF